jgi:hypothetical protein
MLMSKVKKFQNEVMIIFSVALYLMPVVVIIAAFLFARFRIRETKQKE